MQKKYIILAIIAMMIFFAGPARSDVVVLKTGKTVEVEKVWREKGKVWIVYQGLRASIPQSKVDRIENQTKKDPDKIKQQKKATSDVKKHPAASHRSPSIQQTTHTAQSTPMPPAAELDGDQRRIFPEGPLSNLRWGTKITEIRNLKKVLDADEQEGVSEYQQKVENLTFGKAELSTINYAFWRDRLYMLTIPTNGRSNFTALRGEVFRQFGRGLRSDPKVERYLWTEGPNDILLQYSRYDHQGFLWLRSSELDREYKLSQIRSHASYLNWMKSRN